MKKVIITGATSGIGEALAFEFAKRGYAVGIAGRRTERLVEIQKRIPDCVYESIDVSDTSAGIDGLKKLIQKLGGMDVLIINAGVGHLKPNFEQTDQLINVNIRAFAQQAAFALDYFKTNKQAGKITGISSFATHVAMAGVELYSASKSFVSRYWQGIRQAGKASGLEITVTEIRPGYVKSEMTAGQKGMFWLCETDKAARQIVDATESGKAIAYVSRRWRLLAWVLYLIPDVWLDGVLVKSK